MTQTLKEELEALLAPGLADWECAAKWLGLLTAHVAALEARAGAPTQDTALSILTRENGHLRAEVAAVMAQKNAASVAQWPTPQPIETAPLVGNVLAFYVSAHGGGAWRVVSAPFGGAATHWLPMPPPPGGGK